MLKVQHRLALPVVAAVWGAVSLFSYVRLGWGDVDTTGVHDYVPLGTSRIGTFGAIIAAAVAGLAAAVATRWRRPVRTATSALVVAAVVAVGLTAAHVHQLEDNAHFGRAKGTAKLTFALLVVRARVRGGPGPFPRSRVARTDEA